jgi:ABC-2 type transport system permease protein
MNTLAPLWLMARHEARLSWRQMSARTSHKWMLWSLVGFLVMMHLIALPVPFVLSEMRSMSQVDIMAAVTAVGAGVLLTAIPLALIGTVKLMYSRGDMDLLLSSPVPARAVVVVRVLTIAFGLLCIGALFILPFANTMALFGYPRALVAYVVLTCLALAATAIGLLLAQGMFWLFGPRRTRLFAQLFAGVLGVGFLFAINAHNILPATTQSSALQILAGLTAHLPSADSWVWLPARAALGEPLPFLVGLVLCLGLFVATTFGLANRLMANAIAANSVAGKTVKSSSRMLRTRGGPVAIMRRKEWLLIGRDPWLMSQIVMQLLLMLPAMFVIWNAGTTVTYMWLAVVYLAGHLAGMLAWLTVSTEEAPDLLTTAPVQRSDVISAKLQAALMPTAMMAAVPVAAAWYVDLWLGFTIMLCSAGGALSTSLLHVRYPATAKRSDFSWRGSSSKMLPLAEMLLGLMWIVFGALMLAFGWWGMLALVVLIPIADRMMRGVEALEARPATA